MRRKKIDFLELFLLKDKPCTWEMLKYSVWKFHVFVFALHCFLSAERNGILSKKITGYC